MSAILRVRIEPFLRTRILRFAQNDNIAQLHNLGFLCLNSERALVILSEAKNPTSVAGTVGFAYEVAKTDSQAVSPFTGRSYGTQVS